MEGIKKLFVFLLIILLILGISIGIFFYIKSKNKTNQETIFNQYISNINNKDYEAMYEMLDEESKQKISKEDFITRNKNIYEGLNASNLKIEIKSNDVLDNKKVILSYFSEMESFLGNINFENKVEMKTDKEKCYLISWSSNLIFPELNDDDKVKIKSDSAVRGSIVDRNGIAIAENGYVSSIGIVPGKLGTNKEEDLNKMAELLEIDVNSINKALSASWVNDESFVPIKKVSKDKTDLKNELLQIPGVKITNDTARTYPFGEAISHLTGYVQNITAEELEKNAEKGYNSNSIIGKAGLEKKFEDRLKGKDGKEVYIEDSDGKKKTTIGKIDVQNGENIKLTIDLNIQMKLYNELKEDKGFFVVMNPKSGEILALVSTPSYDANDFVLGLSTEKWNLLKEDINNPMMARYLQKYCPGSTFKPITAGIGLTTKTLNIDDEFNYEGLSWKKNDSWGNYNITTLTAYNGAKNMKNAIIHSDNIYFAQAALKIGKDNFTESLNKLKFNENIDFILDTAKSQYSNNEKIEKETLLADSGYGQGEILINPIHMASIYSAFVNNGNMVKPYLEYKDTKETEYLVEQAFSEESANQIKDYLLEVVENPEGTANDMKLENVTIAGKTGTAELKKAKDEKGETLGWFDCFTLNTSDDNSILIISMVENASENGGSHYLIKKIKSLF